ncbi:hypothetical protein Hanom_Chr15g01379071 [Helianthus anomalus]
MSKRLHNQFNGMFSSWYYCRSIRSWCRWVYDEHRSWALYPFMNADKRKLWPAVFWAKTEA